MAAAREDTKGIRRVRTKEMLPWARQIGPETTQALTLLSQVAVTNPTSNCQPSQQLRRRQLIEYRKHGTIKAEILHICTQRADRNAAVIKKWHVQESDHGCRQRRVANANPLPVEGQEYDRQKFHCDS